MKNFEKFLEKVILEYLEEVDFDIEGIESEDLIDSVDPQFLSKEISKHIQERVLKFTPSTYMQYSSSCPECNKMMGSWFSENGMEISDYLICQPNKTILIMEDF